MYKRQKPLRSTSGKVVKPLITRVSNATKIGIDQLLDKRQYSQTDQVETAFDDNGNDVVVEREEEYEENREQDEAGKKQYRFHR